ncbi:MAG: DUF4375 domain-containing protein [Pseudomonadota bacterium]
MFGIFGKKKADDRIEPSLGESDRNENRASGAPPSGQLSTILVRQSIAEAATSGSSPYDLIQEVINYTNFLMEKGLYRREEMPREAVQAYHADYYLAQVNNGGHSQFIGNSASNAANVWADALAALQAMKACEHAAILERMLTWVRDNSDEAKQQTGFSGGVAADLKELDEEFYKLENENPMIPLSAAWVLGWPSLKIVSDETYADALRELIGLNPRRAERLVARRIASLKHQINDHLHVSIGMAGLACNPPEMRLAIGGGSHLSVDGEDQLLWSVNTDGGARFAVVTSDGAAIYDRIEDPTKIDMKDPEDVKAAMEDGRLQKLKGPSVGHRLSFVGSSTISRIVATANRVKAAEAIDLLLRQASINAERISVAALSDPQDEGPIDRVQWVVFSNAHAPVMALTDKDGSVLVNAKDHTVLAKVRADDIARHARMAEL